MQNKHRPMGFLVEILFLQIILCVVVLFNIPVARQVISFIYLTFVPGHIIVRLLRLYELDKLEILLYSLGLSVAFLMLAGLLVNELGYFLGFQEPLSMMPLLLTVNSFVLAGGILIYLRGEAKGIFSFRNSGFPFSSGAFLSLPILSVVGTTLVNSHGDNRVLLVMITLIALLFVIGVAFKRLLSPRFYPFALFMFAISLLYQTSLISNYVWGSDIHLEYYVFESTVSVARWNPVLANTQNILLSRLNSMLSLTILPTFYASLLNMDATWVFKILYPAIFAFLPLTLYQLWQNDLGEKRALLAAFLMIAQNTFFTELLGLNRQMIAELFLVLLLLVVFSKKMKQLNKMGLFMIFSFGLITSHYALAEIFLLFISAAWISLLYMKKPSRKISMSMIVLFPVVMLFWYIYTSNSAAFDTILSFGNYLGGQLGQFLNPASRGTEVLTGLGLTAAPSIWNTLSRAFSYATELLILVGFTWLMLKRKDLSFGREYFVFTTIAVTFVAALLVVPGLATTLRMARFYHLLLFFLAPLCVLGAEAITKLMSKSRTQLSVSFLLIILIPYFLFQTGFVYEVVGAQSYSLSLSKYRMDRLFINQQFVYVDEPSVIGIEWMSKTMNTATTNTSLYVDWFSYDNLLESYGMTPRDRSNINLLSNVTALDPKGVVFLSQLNVVFGKIAGETDNWNTTVLAPVLANASVVYLNGNCEIYISNP